MTRPARDLIRLLDRERELLRAGDAAGAAALLARKSELVDRIERDGADARLLDEIRRKAERNAPLLQSARDGIAAARLRITAILGGVTTQTYSAQGQATALDSGRRTLERRA